MPPRSSAGTHTKESTYVRYFGPAPYVIVFAVIEMKRPGILHWMLVDSLLMTGSYVGVFGPVLKPYSVWAYVRNHIGMKDAGILH
jgi:hypothetical protein